MDLFLLTVGLIALLVLLMFLTARLFGDYRVADLLDWKPTRSPAVEAQNEIDDVQQMLEAQNEYRRRRGERELTEEDVQRQAKEDEAVRARGRGPFAQAGGHGDEEDAPGERR